MNKIFDKILSHKEHFAFAAKGLTVSLLSYFGAAYAARTAIKATANKATKRIMTDKYDENLWELVSATTRATPQVIVETNLRSEEGQAIKRPLGSPKKFPDLGNLMFNIAQLDTLPTPNSIMVDMQVVIGPQAKKPLIIDFPVMISGMATGLALSEKTKIALAKGCTKAGTASNTGEGVFSIAERKAAKKLILQYPRGHWNKTPNIIKQGDMIEIQLGQGASAGIQHSSKAKDISLKVSRKLGLKPGQDAIIPAGIPGIKTPKDLKKLVDYLRDITGGVPIGVKMGAGKYLERDLEFAVAAGVDAIALDGAEAATVGATPILQDDFGLPTLLMASRAGRFFEKNKLKGKVSLIIGGGLYVPGEFLKAIALGADAVYIGSIALFATAHTEVLKALPLEPPTQVIWETGHFKNKFNVNKGAKSLEKYLKSCRLELEEGVRALGKSSIHDVNKNDLYALDPDTAAIAQVDLGYDL